MDPFNNEVIGTINNGMQCSEWSEHASSWVSLVTNLHYTNSHSIWIKMGFYNEKFALEKGAII